MFDAYFKALLARNRLITETMIRNQQIVADLFSRNLDFGADFLQHQMRVLSLVTQWRASNTQATAEPAPTSTTEKAAEPPAELRPKLKIVQTRR